MAVNTFLPVSLMSLESVTQAILSAPLYQSTIKVVFYRSRSQHIRCYHHSYARLHLLVLMQEVALLCRLLANLLVSLLDAHLQFVMLLLNEPFHPCCYLLIMGSR